MSRPYCQLMMDERRTIFRLLEAKLSRRAIADQLGRHSPWQKGSIENTNGRLRRFLRGELDPAAITPADLRATEARMNTTPRKCLGFRRPGEAFAAALG